MTANDQSREVKRNRIRLVLVMAVALVPLGLSYALYYQLQGSTPWSTTNHGDLLAPVVDAATLEVRGTDGTAVELKHIWRLMLITEKGCQDTCLEALKQLKALQILLGKDGDRIQRTLVVRAAGPDDESGHPESVIAALSERFPDLELLIGIDMPLAEGLYIVDPLGNVILRYASQDAGKPVLTDLKKLLKVSQIG